MLDPDITTADALRHLSAPVADDPFSLDRRRFLQLVGLGLGAGLVAGPGSSLLDAVLPGHDPLAWAAGPIGPNDGILVLIGLYGGNDGLNTVVPVNDGRYYDQHGSLAVPASSTLRLDANTGLHPELGELKQFWDAGKLAIVEGVGHLQNEFSHFSSMAKWMSARPTGLTTSGWIGRWLDGYLSGTKDLFAAAEIGHSLPLHMIGERSVATTVPTDRPSFGVPREWRADADRALFQTIRDLGSAGPAGSWQRLVGQAQIDILDVGATLNPVIPDDSELPDTEIVRKLEIAARLINANLGMRVLSAGYGDFDSHAGQPSQHPVRMQELNSAINRFYSTLHPSWVGRVTVMTFSEFGRTSYANDGQGTDHGSSAPQLVFGAGVKGGFYGQRPSLAGLRRWDRMPSHVDMRSYYGSVIDGWLGGGSSGVLGGNFENLRLFERPPSGSGTVPVASGSAPSAPSVFVAVTPQRVYDSRNGLGGRRARVGPGQTVQVGVSGEGAVPVGATAAAINVTAVLPSIDTFLTAYPTGQRLPDSSTLNPRPGIVTANSAVVGLGTGGAISIYNNAGHVDLLVDVMGYFVAPTNGASTGFHPLSPSRLLDTRTGNGAPKRRLRERTPISLQIVGRGSVPSSGVAAVVVNLLAVDPNGEGWVVGWPTGETMPVVSNVQYQPGRTVPTLAVVTVGAGGKIDLMASAGTLDLVVDVVGYFATSGSTMQSVGPRRLLDTRTGNGAPATRVGPGDAVNVRVVGRGGVPVGASAAALNVTAVAPSDHTYLTVYPGGEPRPATSSLNPDRMQVSANLVLSKIGTDGTINIYNNRGDVDIVADLTAFFT